VWDLDSKWGLDRGGEYSRHRPLAAALAVLSSLAGILSGCTREEPRASRLDRGTVHVAIAETLDGIPTDTNIAQTLITRTLLHRGFHLASAEEARYLVEGRLACTYHKELKMTFGEVQQLLEHQWLAEFTLTLTDRGPGGKGPEDSETFSFPEPMRNGRTDPELARRDIRRRAATDMAKLIAKGRIVGDPQVRQLLDALQDPFDPRRFDDVEREIVDLGARAVPYLLDALLDTRPVRMVGSYPDFEKFDPEDLKVYHLADRMLSEILARNAALDLLSTEPRRLQVITGWTWAWEDEQGIPDEYRIEREARATKVPDKPY
jgi:hypothetical protein